MSSRSVISAVRDTERTENMSTISVLFLVAIVSSVAFGQDAETKCLVGRRYHDGCNNCFCHESGVLSCTLMACLTFDPKTGKYVSLPSKLELIEDESS